MKTKTTLFIITILLAIALSSCSSEPLNAQAVIDEFNAAGLDVRDVKIEERDSESPLPNSFQERWSFSVPEVAPRGGQIFVCDTKENCDALYLYFDMLKAIGGPYYYQSPSGLVVAQMNSGLTPDTASKFAEVISSLP